MIDLFVITNKFYSTMISRHNKLKFIWITGFVFPFFLQEVSAQQEETKSLHSFTGGVSSRLISDEYNHLSLEKIIATDFSWQFSNFNAYRRKQLSVNWSGGRSEAMQLNELNIEYSEAFSLLKDKTNRFNFYLGYKIGTDPVFINARNQQVNSHSWANTTSFSFYSAATYYRNKNKFLLDLSLPLIGFGSRPLMTTTYQEDVNALMYNSLNHVFFTSLHNQQAVNISIQYSRELTNRISLQAGCRYNYQQIKEGYYFLEKGYGFYAGFLYQLK